MIAGAAKLWFDNHNPVAVALEIKRTLDGGPDDFGGSVWDVPLRRQPAGSKPDR